MWESCSPGYSGHLFHQQKSQSLNKKLTFGPKYPNFGVKKAHFRPQRPIGGPPINVFNTKKVSHWNPDMRVPKFLLPAPEKLDFGPKYSQIWSKICIFGHFGPNIAIFCTFCPMTDQKKCEQGEFSVMWVTKLLISQVKKKDFLPQNDQIWPKIGIFGQFGPGHTGFFGALLVGRLVVVARGLYLARHLFT